MHTADMNSMNLIISYSELQNFQTAKAYLFGPPNTIPFPVPVCGAWSPASPAVVLVLTSCLSRILAYHGQGDSLGAY